MKAAKLTHPLKDATLTLRIEQSAGFKIRLMIGIWLIRAAAWVMGGRSEVETRTVADE